MKVFKDILAAIAGFTAASISIVVISFVLSFLFKIPILGSILTFPVDTGWFAGITLNTTPIGIGAQVATKIEVSDWGHRIMGGALAFFYMRSIFSSFTGGRYNGFTLAFHVFFLIVGLFTSIAVCTVKDND